MSETPGAASPPFESDARRALARDAWIACAAHLVAGGAMALVLRHGLDTNRDIDARVAWLDGHRLAWIAGWASWNLAALSFLAFVASFRRARDLAASARSRTRWIALLVATAAVALDLAAESIEMGAVPSLARDAMRRAETSGAREQFLAVHDAVVLMTGGVANGLYTLSVLLLTASSCRDARSKVLGAAVVVAGLAVSWTSFVRSVDGMLWSNAALVPLLALWLASVARDASARADTN